MYTPKNLKKWTLPGSYIGPTYEEYFVFLVRNGGSSILENVNFDFVVDRLKEIGEESENTFQIIRDRHWAVGWIEYILIHESAEKFLEKADSIQEDLNEYPSLDDDEVTRLEGEEADRIWKEYYNTKERIEYIRNHRSQFEFQDYTDMIRCVRGEYFAGYSSELID